MCTPCHGTPCVCVPSDRKYSVERGAAVSSLRSRSGQRWWRKWRGWRRGRRRLREERRRTGNRCIDRREGVYRFLVSQRSREVCIHVTRRVRSRTFCLGDGGMRSLSACNGEKRGGEGPQGQRRRGIEAEVDEWTAFSRGGPQPAEWSGRSVGRSREVCMDASRETDADRMLTVGSDAGTARERERSRVSL